MDRSFYFECICGSINKHYDSSPAEPIKAGDTWLDATSCEGCEKKYKRKVTLTEKQDD